MAVAQSPPPAGSGVNSQWDVRQMLTSLQARAQQLGPMLDRLKPDDWVKNGAP